MIEWISHSNKRRLPPETIGRAVRAMEWPTSNIIVETNKYISIDFVPVRPRGEKVKITALYHFIREDNSWFRLKGWSELDDEHRLLLRAHPDKSLYEIGKYKDHRYYTLEVLSASHL